MNRQPFISLENTTIEAHGRVLFKDLSWQILENEQWAVIGPNGSGRSSLMRAIAGTLPVSEGTITRASDDIEYVSFETQKQLLPHETFLQDRWNAGLAENAPTVGELLSERRILHDNPFIVADYNDSPSRYLTKNHKYRNSFEERKEKVVRQLGIKNLLPRTVLQLSNGERRKVIIARALLKNPRLLILDNPFEGLDERFRKKLAKTLSSLMRGGIRLIIVETSRDEIPDGITHVLEITENGIVSGSPRQGKTLPLTKLPNRIRTTKMRAGKIIVQMKKVNVSYDGRKILKNINWTIREHERWALFGPNGAGKTTLLSLILADNPQAFANDITIFGKRKGSGESIWEIKKNIGSVSPELQLYYPFGMTCLDVACSGWFDSIGLYRECSDDQKEIALAWLEKFGVAEQAGELFSDVSEGEQRLTLLARALVKNPRLLILDEPCQGLDPKHRERVLEAIDGIEKDAATIIYVTHRADELPKSITNMLRLDKK